jgi:hypothetical protein
LNGSRQTAAVTNSIDRLGGAQQPPDSLFFPSGFSPVNGAAFFSITPFPLVAIGLSQRDDSRQLQAVDNLSLTAGAHQFRFGADYRWFSPEQTIPQFLTILGANGSYRPTGFSGGALFDVLDGYETIPHSAFVAAAFSAYAQDTWRVSRRVTLTYGLRWEVDPSPRVSAGQAQIGIATTPATLAPSGKPFYPTSWSNFAPRLGIAWQIRDGKTGKTVLRVGAGRFFDPGQSGLGGPAYHGTSLVEFANQPLGSTAGGAFVAQATNPISSGTLTLVAPNYKLPFTWEWNATIEQAIGHQTFSVGYIGALGRRLEGWTEGVTTSDQATNFTFSNDADSSYQALQFQFNRRLSSRLHVLVSYTWAHSIDNLSNDEPYLTTPIPASLYIDPRARGSSDFDVRHSLNGSIITALPSPHGGASSVLFRDWTANSIFFVRSALPTDLYIDNAYVRPDLAPGQPLYLYGSEYPGGKSFNGAAFIPPAGAEGELGRNVLRGLGAWQIDFALHREFALREHVSLQFRAEAFNILNHPNFANPSDTDSPGVLTVPAGPPWGAASQTLANGLGSTGVVGQLSPLFQIGGPRTMQIALRLHF